MRAERLQRLALLAAGLFLASSRALAQEGSPDRVEFVAPLPGPSVSGIARYDGGGRRDPFVPLYDDGSSEGTGPRFEMLKLTGIFQGSGANGLVVLEDPSSRGHFVRLGQQLGDARLVEILPQAAVFEVFDYGASRRVILRLEDAGETP